MDELKNYKVYTWGGSGYFCNTYDVQATSYEDAYDKGLLAAIKDNGIQYISPEDLTEDELDEIEAGEWDYWTYVDLTLDGGGCYYVNLENFKIEEVEQA